MSCGFASGLIDNERIRYCPYCGKRIGDYYADGTAECTDSIDGRYTITEYYCPSCGRLLDSVFRNYCGNCGQAIELEE